MLNKHLVIFISLVGAVACRDKPVTQDIKVPGKTQSNLIEKQSLVEALQKLKVIFASNDPGQIGQIFHFPLDDSIASPFMHDSAYDREKNQNNEEMTRDMYDRYFPALSKGWQLGEMNQLFAHVTLSQLYHQDKISYLTVSKKDPCIKQYFIQVRDSLVTLTYGTNSNPGYTAPKKQDDEAIGDECEFDIIWEFIFDGKDLHFVRELAAG